MYRLTVDLVSLQESVRSLIVVDGAYKIKHMQVDNENTCLYK